MNDVPRRFHAVVFDFDYTLADSSRGIVACVNHALGALNLPVVTAERACRTIGLTLPETFARLAGEGEAGRSPDFVRAFVAKADEIMNANTVLVAPARQAVTALLARGLRLAIVSTKYRYRIEDFLRREGLLDAFGVIVGLEDVAVPKPEPSGLLAAIARLGTRAQAALYVGDSVVDALTAQRAGVAFAAVLSGMTARYDFAPYPAYAILETVADVPQLVCREDGQRPKR